jgi:hydrogenase expression/formation protein HypE
MGGCPLPITGYEQVLLAHGGGGRLTQELLAGMILPQFANPLLEPLHDGAVLPVDGGRVAFTTDSYVVSPLFFPGGDIGALAVNGTVNDLAMCGARPLYLSAGLIIEEGFPMEALGRVIASMQRSAAKAGVSIVTGDTKVVDRGKGDGLFINTSGIGLIGSRVRILPKRAAVGDKILLSGQIAQHGIAIMALREGLEFETQIASDTAPLAGLVQLLLKACEDVHVLRDPTRGGVASALNEIASQAEVGMLIHEARIPIAEEVSGACEILGLDPLYIANEGKLLAFVPADDAERALDALHAHPYGRDAAIIGEVVGEHPGMVAMETRIGGRRLVDMLSGEQLPRIC